MTVIVLWLFLTVLSVGLQSVIVVFPDHTHLLFLYKCNVVLMYLAHDLIESRSFVSLIIVSCISNVGGSISCSTWNDKEICNRKKSECVYNLQTNRGSYMSANVFLNLLNELC